MLTPRGASRPSPWSCPISPRPLGLARDPRLPRLRFVTGPSTAWTVRSWNVTGVTLRGASTADPGPAPQNGDQVEDAHNERDGISELAERVGERSSRLGGVTVRRSSYGPGGPTGTSCGTEAFLDPELL